MSTTARVLRPAAVVLAAGLVVLTLGWGESAVGAPRRVDVVDFAFEPTAVSVTVGETVTWRWAGDARHSVTAPGRFDSHPDCTALTPEACGATGDAFTWTADQPGTVSYRCRVHPDQMQGVVEVLAAAESPSPSPGPSSPAPTTGPSPSPTPTAAPAPSPPPSATPAPSPSPSRTPVGPPTSPPAQPVPTITPTASPTPSAAASPVDPDLEPFPAPVEPTSSPSPDALVDDVVAVGSPGGDPTGRLRVVASVAVGLSALTFARVVLLRRGWF